MKTDISVIIPVFHEAAIINTTIQRILKTDFPGNLEIIVVDGAREGETCRALKAANVKKLFSEKGRGRQMNRGALGADGEVLLFLHADTRIGGGGLSAIHSAVQQDHCAAGAFDLRIDAKGPAYRLIEGVASLRTRTTRVPYGDQAIFVRRDVFERVGGYPEIPLMEDVELMRRIKKTGGAIRILNEKATTSARRWQQEGLLYTTLRNWTLVTLYLFGVSAERLARYYKDERPN
jgi:rSAM/selenodomain-associated transferase 2